MGTGVGLKATLLTIQVTSITYCNSHVDDIYYMAITLFPVRTRCYTCRKKLEDLIPEGMFCSYACAQKKAPSAKVDLAPRHCKREVNGRWDFKQRYTHEGAVPQKLRDDPATNIYRCDYCLHLHVGHSRQQKEIPIDKLSRTVRDLGTVGTVVTRMMIQRKTDRKALAKKLNVPIIRIKEIEEASPDMRVDILFRALDALRVTVNLTER